MDDFFNIGGAGLGGNGEDANLEQGSLGKNQCFPLPREDGRMYCISGPYKDVSGSALFPQGQDEAEVRKDLIMAFLPRLRLDF